MSAPTTGLVPVDEYLDYRDTVRPDQQLWENNGWSIRGADGTQDYLFWASPYFIQGIPGGHYLPGRLALDQTLLITHPLDAPDELTDNDFVAVGWDPVDVRDWTSASVERADDVVTWDLGSRTYRAARDFWRVSGDGDGVSCDLVIRPAAAPMWFTDPQRSIAETGNRWWIANGRADGWLRTGDASIEVDAHGVHERHIHLGTAHDPVRLLDGGGVAWFTAAGEDVNCAVLSRPSYGANWAQLVIDGEAVEARDASVQAVTESTWHDPASGMLVGQAWRLRIEHAAGAVELAIRARARAYYTWNFLAEGSTVLYWWLCTADAVITGPGPRRTVTGLAAETHLNRTFARRHGVRRD